MENIIEWIKNIDLNKRGRRSIVFFTFSLLASTVVYPQSNSYTGKYNLDFQLKDSANDFGWKFDFTESGMSLKKDSLMCWNGNIPLVMTRVKLMDIYFSLKGAIQQRILLPKVNADSAEIQITCKSQHLKKAYLVIGGIDSQEAPLFRDTIHIAQDIDWSTFKGCVPLKNIAMIHLKIAAEGKHDSLPQNLWLDKVEILIDGKKIDDHPLPIAGELAGLPLRPTPLSFVDETCYSQIPELRNKKVLAIGESFHGSGTIGKISQQLMKYQIINNNCKLILFERPIEEMLSINRFVQGDEAFRIDSLAQITRDNFYLPFGNDFLDFFSWLKEYNKHIDNKVSVLGMDISLNEHQSNNYFFNYLFTINKDKKHPLIDSLCVQLLESKSLSPIIQRLSHNKEFEAIVGAQESELFNYCLQLSDRLITSRSRIPLRDSLMNSTTQFLMNHLCSHNEKITIYSHLFHSSYLYHPVSMSPIFGSFMKGKYGDNYFCIGVIAGEGDLLSVEFPTPVVKILQAPIKNSLENLFYQTGLSYCYLPLQTGLNNPIYMRYIGSDYTKNQYYTIVPSARMDGVIFVRNSKAITLPQNTIDKNYRGNAFLIWMNNRKRMGIGKDRKWNN